MTKDEQWLLEEKYGGIETPEFEADRKRLASGEPLGYVIGWQPFLGLKIYLDSHPLIPRPETEWWSEQLLAEVGSRMKKVKSEREYLIEEVSQADEPRASKFLAENYASPKSGTPASFKFLDLCAGSGAIGCAALAKLPNAHVYFGEIDPAHEATIAKNIRENNLDEPSSPKTSSRGGSRASIHIGDLFEPFDGMKFDVIAANPPYVSTDHILPPSVADYEPALALLAGENGLDIIRRIATELPKHLAHSGIAWVECDSEHAAAAAACFTAQGLTALIRTDQYGKPRVIVCRHTRARSAQQCCSTNIIGLTSPS